MRRILRALASVLALGVIALFTFDLRHARQKSTPELISRLDGHGPLLVGAGSAEIRVPYPVVAAGYGPRDRHEVKSAAQPQMSRAISLQVGEARLTLVSLDLLEVDSQLPGELRARLPNDAGEVWLCATHTHSGMGNYDPNLLAQLAGTGRFKPPAREALLEAISQSIARARADLSAPDSIDLGTSAVNTIDRSNSGDATDPSESVIVFARRKVPIPVIFNFAAHPTLVPRSTSQLDADFPADVEAAGGPQTLTAFFQGAVGNASASDSRHAFVDRVTQHPDKPMSGGPIPNSPTLELATARVPLPQVQIHAGPDFTRRASSNLVDDIAPRTAEVSIARLGPITMLAIPGEPTAASGRELRKAIADPHALIFGLCNGYVGYIESEDRVEKNSGESPRQYFEASLLADLAQGAQLAAQATASQQVDAGASVGSH